MDCIGSPTRNRLRPSPACQPEVSVRSRSNWVWLVSWNSSMSRWRIEASSFNSSSPGSSALPSAAAARWAISMKSTSPVSAKRSRNCATASARVSSCAPSTSHCASVKCGAGISRTALSRRTQGAWASAASSHATKGSLCAHLAGKPRFLLTVLRRVPVPVSNRCATARHWSSRPASGSNSSVQSSSGNSLFSSSPSCRWAAASRAGPQSASAQPRGMASQSASRSSPMASASVASIASRSDPWRSSGSH
ncbi:hypothetical protein D9M68_465220 [compost metagenome]